MSYRRLLQPDAGSASAAAATSRYRRPPYDGAARGGLSWCRSFRTAPRQARAGSACCRRTAAITTPSTATSSTTDFLGLAEAARQTRCGGRVALAAVAPELEAVATGGHRVSHLWLVVRRRAPLLLARRHEGGWTCGVRTLLGRGGAPRRLRALAVPASDSINCCAMRSTWLVEVLASTWLACYGRDQGRVDERHVCWRSGAKGGCGVTGRARVRRAAVYAARAACWVAWQSWDTITPAAAQCAPTRVEAEANMSQEADVPRCSRPCAQERVALPGATYM